MGSTDYGVKHNDEEDSDSDTTAPSTITTTTMRSIAKVMPRDHDLSAEIASTIAQFTRAQQAAARDDRVYLTGSTQLLHGGRSRRRRGTMGATSEDLELPDVCPECGFEPEHPELETGDGAELAEAREKRLRGEVASWKTTGTTATDGTHEAVTRCPDCETIVRCVEVPDDETGIISVP